jgi:hypothetical protein
MNQRFIPIVDKLGQLLSIWEPKLASLDESVISEKLNRQHRSVRQIVGHMVDSASNNTHRLIHLQYQQSPVQFPNYATQGNNDRWIAIQDYQHEEWHNLVQLWKYANLHFIHIVENVNPAMHKQEWIASPSVHVTLEEMVLDYLPHFKLHLGEIEVLIN